MPERLPTVEAIMGAAAGGSVEIYTSVLTVTEVAFAEHEQSGKLLDREAEERINQLWIPPSPVRLIEFHQLLAQDAKQIMREAITRGWSAKPGDSIHLATAKSVAVDEFHTYDEKLDKFREIIGIKIDRPYSDVLAFPSSDPVPKA